MAYAKNFEFNGFKFQFVTLDGIAIWETAETVDEPEFQKALKTALEMYPYWNRATCLGEIAFNRELTPEEFIDLQDIVASCPDTEFSYCLFDCFFGGEEYRKRQESAIKARELKRGSATCKPGYVYLAVGDKGFHKIGKARTPKNRLSSLKKGGIVEYVCVIKTDDYSGLEWELHEQFADKRVFSEWFRLDAEDVEYIKSLVVQP